MFRRLPRKLAPFTPAFTINPEPPGLARPFRDFEALYKGGFPAYHACDTGYHDVQHVLDVTLAMARLLHGYQRAGREPIDDRLFCFGVILALYHDCGYIRHRRDARHANGAEYTLTHVSRGARYLRATCRDRHGGPGAGCHPRHPLYRLRNPDRQNPDRSRFSASSAICSAPPTSWARWRIAATWKNATTGCFRSSCWAGSRAARQTVWKKSCLRRRPT